MFVYLALATTFGQLQYVHYTSMILWILYHHFSPAHIRSDSRVVERHAALRMQKHRRISIPQENLCPRSPTSFKIEGPTEPKTKTCLCLPCSTSRIDYDACDSGKLATGTQVDSIDVWNIHLCSHSLSSSF